MPRTNVGKSKYEKLGRLIVGAKEYQGRTNAEVGAMLNLSCTRAINKYLKHPEMLPVDKLLKLCRGMNIPIEEVRECIRY